MQSLRSIAVRGLRLLSERGRQTAAGARAEVELSTRGSRGPASAQHGASSGLSRPPGLLLTREQTAAQAFSLSKWQHHPFYVGRDSELQRRGTRSRSPW